MKYKFPTALGIPRGSAWKHFRYPSPLASICMCECQSLGLKWH